jgi:hypothetical protein
MLPQNVTSVLWQSLQELVFAKSNELVSVYRQTTAIDSFQIELLFSPFQPPLHVIDGPLPWIYAMLQLARSLLRLFVAKMARFEEVYIVNNASAFVEFDKNPTTPFLRLL